MNEIRANPFCARGDWFWRDMDQVVHGPFGSQTEALYGLLKSCDGRSRWAKFRDALRELLAA